MTRLVVLGIFIAGCGGGSTATVELTVSVTEGLSTASSAGQVLPADGDPLQAGQRISFTPSSMKVRIRGAYLCPELVPLNGGFNCSIPQIDLVGDPTEIELVGGEAFADLLTISAGVGNSLYGDYRGTLLLYGEGTPTMPGEGSFALISGTVTLASGYSYVITDVPVEMQTTGITLSLPTAVTVDENVTSSFQVLFDIDDVAHLGLTTETFGPLATPLPDDPTVSVGVDQLILLPFAGDQPPTVEKYDVELTSGDFGDPQTWYLKTTVFLDAASELVSVGWQVNYRDDFAGALTAFSPGLPFVPVITKTGSTYSISEDPSTSLTPDDRRLSFPAFELADHTGVLDYGATSYDYTATKRP